MNKKYYLINVVLTVLAFVIGFVYHAYFFKKQSNITEVATGQISTFVNTPAQLIVTDNKNKIVEFSQENHQISFKSSLKQLLAQESSLVNKSKIALLVAQWAEQDALAALAFVASQQASLVLIVMEIAGKQQNQQVFYWLQERTAHSQYTYWLQSYFQSLANVSVSSALAYADSLDLEQGKNDAIMTIVNVWGKVNPEEVFDWLAQQTSSTFINEITYNALINYIAIAPRYAADKILALPSNSQQEQLLMQLLDKLAQQDIYQAFDLLARLPLQQEQKLVGVVLSKWVNLGKADEALAYLLSRDNLQLYQDAFQATIINIAEQNPNLLLERLSEFSNTTKSMVIDAIATSKVNKNNEYFYTWLDYLPDEETYQLALIATINASYHINPEQAFLLAENIYLEADKMQKFEVITQSWSKTNKLAAINTVFTSAALSQRQKNTLVAEINQHR